MTGFRKGTRERARARIAIDGPSGSGKSLTALRFAFALGKKVAVIDSERRSALLYVTADYDGVKFDFDHMELTSYNPAEYTAAIAAAAGYDVLVIDSLSHAWEGVDGVLEMVDKKTVKGFSFGAWKDVTPVHRRMVEAILAFPGHVIVTMRSKVEYVLETNAAGKQVPRKIGMAPIQRAGMEYEFTLYCSMDEEHFIRVSKCRGGSLDGNVGHKPGAGFLAPFVAWLNTGEVIAPAGSRIEMATDDQVKSLLQFIVDLEMQHKMFRAELFKRFAVEDAHLLTKTQAVEILGVFETRKADRAKLSSGSLPASTGSSDVPAVLQQSGEEGETLQEAMTSEGYGKQPDGVSPPPTSGPSREQLLALVAARDRLFTARGLSDIPSNLGSRNDLWSKLLGVFKVKTARELSPADADRLADLVNKKAASEEAAKATKSAAADAGGTVPPAGPPAEPPK